MFPQFIWQLAKYRAHLGWDKGAEKQNLAVQGSSALHSPRVEKWWVEWYPEHQFRKASFCSPI